MTSIKALSSLNPHHRRDFSVTCYSHRIRTRVTSSRSVVRDWIHDIRDYHSQRIRDGRMVVGLGVQWTPPEYPGAFVVPATLQLCIGHRCLIIQLLHADRGVPHCLRKFLSDPNVHFVGVANYRDNKMLQRSEHDLFVSNLVDLRNVASDRAGLSRKISMERLAAELILEMEGLKKETGVGRSDWDDYWLSHEQVEYACVDAFVSSKLVCELCEATGGFCGGENNQKFACFCSDGSKDPSICHNDDSAGPIGLLVTQPNFTATGAFIFGGIVFVTCVVVMYSIWKRKFGMYKHGFNHIPSDGK